jgi:DNA-binding NarL/FixJ family response regulator
MLRIFLADNHVLIRAGLHAVSGPAAIFPSVPKPATGPTRVRMAIQAKPDIVIIDINQPNINGVDAIWQIREGAPTPKSSFSLPTTTRICYARRAMPARTAICRNRHRTRKSSARSNRSPHRKRIR